MNIIKKIIPIILKHIVIVSLIAFLCSTFILVKYNDYQLSRESITIEYDYDILGRYTKDGNYASMIESGIISNPYGSLYITKVPNRPIVTFYTNVSNSSKINNANDIFLTLLLDITNHTHNKKIGVNGIERIEIFNITQQKYYYAYGKNFSVENKTEESITIPIKFVFEYPGNYRITVYLSSTDSYLGRYRNIELLHMTNKNQSYQVCWDEKEYQYLGHNNGEFSYPRFIHMPPERDYIYGQIYLSNKAYNLSTLIPIMALALSIFLGVFSILLQYKEKLRKKYKI